MSSPPETDRYAPGAVIGGKYRLEQKLGEGGMGSVWAAHHARLDTKVAIKLIRAENSGEEMAQRLVQEARAAAKLGHPAIVRVFDVGQSSEGDPFIVMELLEGESLHQRLNRELRLSGVEAVRLLLPIADALRAAHAKGIVHRDIKPDNVFLAREGNSLQPKLVDFGIAKLEERDVDTHLTQKGVILGSPDYMSPEQARGEEGIDLRADVWSFCVVLYESMVGHAPFDGANYHALLRAIVEEEPVPLERRLAADTELSRIVQKGLAKSRADRWQSMQELGAELARWLMSHGVFEDAAGGALEAKWLVRNSDPVVRQSRPSFGSIPGVAATAPGLGAHTPTERRLAGEAPTSVGPVITARAGARRRRLALPLAAVLAALAVMAMLGLRHGRAERVSGEAAPAPAPTWSANVTTSPTSAPSADTAKASKAEPTPVASVVAVEVSAASATAAENAAPPAKAAAAAPRPSRVHLRGPAASAPSAKRAAEKSTLDLLAPY